LTTATGSGRRKDSARLVWDSKPRRGANPKDIDFQTAELVIPNPAGEQSLLSSFAPLLERGEIDKPQMNRLIWGDNLLTMQALLASGYEGKINLIYIDPPFWTGENYYANIALGDETVTKSPSVIERIAYKDYWEGGIDSYLDMMYPRLQLMKRLLADNGTIYVHIDYHVGHYVKILLDEIFGKDSFRNDIIWQRTGAHNDPEKFGVVHDMILCYGKGKPVFNEIRIPLTEEHIRTRFTKEEAGTGRKYAMGPLSAPGSGPARKFGGKLIPPPKGRHWSMGQDGIDNLEKQGRIAYSSTGVPYIKNYEDDYTLKGRRVQSIWTDLLPDKTSGDRTGFATQKPRKLLKRIIEASANKGDLVADFFSGSGTTMVAAEELGMRWLGCDFSKVAIQVARGRLVSSGSRPFLLENIGNYQRQLIYLSGSRIYEIQPIVLKLYGATPRKDFLDLGVRREGDVDELVYVSYPDRPASARKVGELEALAERLDGRGYKKLVILGWDYEYNFDELLEETKRSSKRSWRTEIIPKTIPPEVYEYLKKVRSQDEVEALVGKVKFHDKPFLKLSRPIVQSKHDSMEVTVGIERYVIFEYPIEDDDQRRELEEHLTKDPLALIDYWAIDWDYDGITFKSSWQALRQHGRDIKPVPRTATQSLDPSRKHTVAVRVVDVFGNDASKTLEINAGRKRQ
jgi:adenine-specific DNA-methyltransferase